MAGDTVKIKGTKNGLVIIYNPDRDLDEIKKLLKSKMENSGGFFRGAKFTVHNPLDGENRHYSSELEIICRQYGLIPSREVYWPPASMSGSPEETSPQKKGKARVIPMRQAHPDGDPALLVMRTLRSGQEVSALHSMVILGDVNPGAKVISGESVYVLGSLKGAVHAGSRGNLMSEVFALKMAPVSLRIGTITAETDGLSSITGPATARVRLGKIYFDRAQYS